MCINLLKHKGGKTEFIILGTQQQLQKISHINIQIGNTCGHGVQSWFLYG